MQTHKAILIEPHIMRATIIELEQDNINAIYQALKCDTFDCVSLPNNDVIYIDDEGLLKNPEWFFMMQLKEYSSPVLAGNGLIMGTGLEGEGVSPGVMYDERHMRFFKTRPNHDLLWEITPTPMYIPTPGFVYREI